MSTNPEQHNHNSEEVDLGRLFQMIGNAFRSFFNLIGQILNSLFLAFIWLVLFIKKNIIILAIASVVGLILGFAHEKLTDPVYQTETIIRQNYRTGETLNDLINYLNDLASEKDTLRLADNLNISNQEAANLVGFELSQSITKNQQTLSFVEYKKELDSVTAGEMRFEDYIENTKGYNFRDQVLIVSATTSDPQTKAIESIIERIEQTGYFKNLQRKELEQLNRREEVILETLKESDSLQKVYQKVLEKSVEQQEGSQTSVTIDNNQDQSITKEYELYNKDLELRRELVEIARSKEDKEFIIEVLSESNKIGVLKKTITFGPLELSRKIAYSLGFGFIVLLFLFLRTFMRFIESYNEKLK